jgi:hypothetical protein
MVMDRHFIASLVLVLAGAAASACRDTPLAVNVISNMPPIADAGEAQTLDYSGSPVTVTLDASGSTDPDGKIVGYRWLSGNKGDGGVGRGGPDPKDVEHPEVKLGEGVWVFTLFVYDNDGGISQPSNVMITVGNAVAPEVSECADTALDTIPETCRTCVCGVSDMCRMAIAGCNQGCFDFYKCVQSMCGEYVNVDQDKLTSCVTMGCSAFFGGVAGYMPLDPCINGAACSSTCSQSIEM